MDSGAVQVAVLDPSRQYESASRCDPRGRAASLVYAESQLSAWAKWAKSQPEKLGYPHLSLVYKVMRRRPTRAIVKLLDELRVRGLTARGTETRSLRPSSVGEVPPSIAAVDRSVASLERLSREVIHIEYLNPDYPEEAKAAEAGMYVTDYRRVLKRAKLAVAKRLMMACP